MPSSYYHYTSREIAQNIYCTSEINSPSGRNYVTQDLYTSGAEAAQSLAITGKPVEIACVIPDYILNIAINGPVPHNSPVLGITDPGTGTLIRQGGGNEIVIQSPINSNLGFQTITLTSP